MSGQTSSQRQVNELQLRNRAHIQHGNISPDVVILGKNQDDSLNVYRVANTNASIESIQTIDQSKTGMSIEMALTFSVLLIVAALTGLAIKLCLKFC